MQWNQTIVYALRAMSYLAILPLEEPISARDLSEATNVPVHYLSKIMRRMVTGGLVDSQKGHGGGFQLAKPPKSIRMIDILLVMDYDPESQPCAFGWERCCVDRPCPLHHDWSQLKRVQIDWARQTTLADIRSRSA